MACLEFGTNRPGWVVQACLEWNVLEVGVCLVCFHVDGQSIKGLWSVCILHSHAAVFVAGGGQGMGWEEVLHFLLVMRDLHCSWTFHV